MGRLSMNKKSIQNSIQVHNKISDCFMDMPESGRQAIISTIESKIPPIVAMYADEIGMNRIDFAVNLNKNEQIQVAAKEIAKSESLFQIALDDNKVFIQDLNELFIELSHKSFIVNEDLNKSLKNAFVALGLGGLLMSGDPANAAQQSKAAVSHPSTQSFKANPFGAEPEDSFLHNMMQIESSGGKNTRHKPSTKGASPGDVAIGRWGLMPDTVREMYNRYKQNWNHPDLKIIGKLNNDQLTQHIKKNPDIELHLARSLANHVLNNNNGDELKAAYSWHHGHNIEPHKITETQLRDENVQKYRTLMEGKKMKGHLPASTVMPNAPKFMPKIKKAEGADFINKLHNWVLDREKKDQDQVSNTMQQYRDIENAQDMKKEKSSPIINTQDSNNPIDKIKMAIDKVKEGKNED